MREEVGQKLNDLIQCYGKTIVHERKRCESLLRDVCSDYLLERNILLNALGAGVPAALLAPSPLPITARLRMQISQFRQDCGVGETEAQWGVETWAIAVGAATASQCLEARLQPKTLVLPEKSVEPPPEMPILSVLPPPIPRHSSTVSVGVAIWSLVVLLVASIGGTALYFGRRHGLPPAPIIVELPAKKENNKPEQPDNSQGFTRRTRAEQLATEAGSVLQSFEKAVKQTQTPEQARQERERWQFQLKKARDTSQRALEQDPGNDRAHINFVWAQLALGDLAGAKSSFRKAKTQYQAKSDCTAEQSKWYRLMEDAIQRAERMQ